MHRLKSLIGRITIAKKLAITSAIVIILASISSIYSLTTFRSSREIDNLITNGYYPLISHLKDFRDLVSNTNELSVNWMYLPNPDDKSSLIATLNEAYPSLKKEAIQLLNDWPNNDDKSGLVERFMSYDAIIPTINDFTGALGSDEAYQDDFLLFDLIPQLDEGITAPLEELEQQILSDIVLLEQESNELVAQKFSSFDSLEMVIIIMTILVIILGVGSTILISRSILNPIYSLNSFIQALGLGQFPQDDLHEGDDEIGDMIKSVNRLKDGLISTAKFAGEIGKGNLSVEHELLSDNDILGVSLLTMKENLKSAIEETNSIVSTVANEGRFNERVSLDGKQGAWMELANSINNLFESIAIPFKTVEEILSAMSEGDLSKRYAIEAKGEILKLSEGLNHALDRLVELLSEMGHTISVVSDSSNEMLSSGEEMNSTTNEIASAIAQMSNGAQNQVSKVDESSRLVEIILKSANEMATNSDAIYKAAKKGVEDSQNGSKIVSTVSETIHEIKQVTETTGDAMHALSQRSNEIERVLGVITEISAQTNLLALNAAIEAAQAGDAGRGFAVVAEEIRKLAEDSNKSAKEIEKLISEVSQDTERTVNLMTNMAKSVDKGVDATSMVSQVFDNISASSTQTLGFTEDILKLSKDQTDKIKDVVTITESIVVIAEQTAAGTEEVASSATEMATGMNNYIDKSENLNSISQKLKENLAWFKLFERN